ncbi:MAG: hypothetical protein N2258_07345, partial [Brevinematales bacterium]|nr:hypothetical protein [Brevinematales bacterium]
MEVKWKCVISLVIFTKLAFFSKVFSKIDEASVEKIIKGINSFYSSNSVNDSDLLEYVKKLNPVLLGVAIKSGKTRLDGGPAEGVSEIFYKNLANY